MGKRRHKSQRPIWSGVAVALSLIISFIALLKSCESNRIAESALAAASWTYLSIAPAPLPLDMPVFKDIVEQSGRQYPEARYMIIAGFEESWQASFNVQIRNAGPHEAKNIVLHFKIDLIPAPYDSTVFTFSGSISVDPLAPDQVVDRDFYAKKWFKDMAPRYAGRWIVDEFENDRLDVRARYYLTFTDPSSEDRRAGPYSGTYRFGGRQILPDGKGEQSTIVGGKQKTDVAD